MSALADNRWADSGPVQPFSAKGRAVVDSVYGSVVAQYPTAARARRAARELNTTGRTSQKGGQR